MERREEGRRQGSLHRLLRGALAAPIVRSVATVPKTVLGVKGTFGVIKRPNGKLQVTFRGLALYAYVHDGPNQVLCDNADGWFVARAR